MNTLVLILYILLIPVFIEACTELLVKSEIFKSFREWLINREGFFGKMISCGYCTSVWVSTLPGIIFAASLEQGFFKGIILSVFWVLVFHRMSNYYHNICDKHFDKFYAKK